MSRWGQVALAVVVGAGVGLAALWLRPVVPGRPLSKNHGSRPVAPAAPKKAHLPEVAWQQVERPNFLVLIADDVGVDQIGVYGVQPKAPPTPTIDAMAKHGLLFRNAVANPVCSPTRATIMTGRYAYRYGIGSAIPPKRGWGLPDSELVLPRALRDGTGGAYHSALVGKWHLATPDMGGLDHARSVGFDHHWGTMGNLLGPVLDAQASQTYDHYTRVVDGEMSVGRTYITTQTIDDALQLMQTLPEPWFIFVAFHAAHFPMHAPPAGLFTQRLPPNPSETDLYRAMVESMDTEIGRLLRSMDAGVLGRTDVFFLGDNGSAPVGVLEPFPKEQSKGSVLNGGVAVPLIAVGPDVTARGAETSALVNTVDFFATLLDLAHAEGPRGDDSVSFASVLQDPASGARRYAYAERFAPNGMGPWDEHVVSIRDDRYRLTVTNGKADGLYDLQQDRYEANNLFSKKHTPTPEEEAAWRRLRFALPEVVPVEREPREALIADGVDPGEPL